MSDTPEDKIWLHAEIEADGRVVVRDQNGRKLCGLRSVAVKASMDDADSLSIEVFSGIDRPRQVWKEYQKRRA